MHMFVVAVGGLIKTACGIYLDGPAKEQTTGFRKKTTCKNCRRAQAFPQFW